MVKEKDVCSFGRQVLPGFERSSLFMECLKHEGV